MSVPLIIGRLKAAGLITFDTIVPPTVAPSYPYALVWSTAVPDQRDVNLANTVRAARWEYGITCAGLTPDHVRATSAAVYAALHDWTPAPGDGWHFDHVRHMPGQGQAITDDADTPTLNGAPVMFGVEMYELTATPSEDE